MMPKSEGPVPQSSSGPPRPAWLESQIPEELKEVEDLSVLVKSGQPPLFTFSLDFVASVKAIVRSEDQGGFSAEVPGLPGCFTQGETLEEVRDNLQEAAEGWLLAHHDLATADLFGEIPLLGTDER